MDYRISGQRLEGLAQQARRLANLTEELTPARIEDALRAVPTGGAGALDFPEKVVYFNNMNGFEYAKKRVLFSEYSAASGATTVADAPVTNALWADSMVAVMKDDNIHREFTVNRTVDADRANYLDNGFGDEGHPGFTIGAWFCKTENTDTYERLLFTSDDSGILGLYIPSNSAYQIYRDNLTAGTISTVSISMNRWFHLAYSIERIPGVGLIAKTYLDGNLIATDEMALPNYHFKILSIGAASQYPWPGYVKNAFVSEGALTDEEVRLMMLYEQVSDKSTRIPSADMALTFQMKPYASLEQLALDTPEHGTIGLVTEAAVSKHIFSASEPLLPDEGTVWIQTGLNSNVSFFASENDAMQVCPVLAKQYVEGTWKTIPAKTYLDGGWETWRIPLYEFGDEFRTWTDGWVTKALTLAGTTARLPSVVRDAEHIKMSMSEQKGGIVYCAVPIDLTGHSVLRFEGVLNPASASLGYWCEVVVMAEEFGNSIDECLRATLMGPLDGAGEVDISSLEGLYYIGLFLYGQNTSVTLRKMYIQ